MIDQRDFRNALGSFATGITVVTAKTKNGNSIGVTINSFASVSLDPPMVLFSLKTTSPMTQLIQNCGHFTVNVLSSTQQDISNLFASSGEDKFTQAAHTIGENGAPVLEGCLANLECDITNQYHGGDHMIFVGQVTSLSYETDGDPLLYYKGAYRTIADI